jgi:hypothetical protein
MKRSWYWILILWCCAAPTPGDIGGCGQKAESLDPVLFYGTLKYTDCKQCTKCGFTTTFCQEQCDEKKKAPGAFPVGCLPLAHDGEVCLRKLQSASCDEYQTWVSDQQRTSPSECQFCPVQP